jgi:signal transduction histidine kinase
LGQTGNEDYLHPRILAGLKIWKWLNFLVSIGIFLQIRRENPVLHAFLPWMLAFLFLASGILIFTFNKDFILLFLNLLAGEYVLVLLFQYFDPHFIIFEILWFPLLLLEGAVLFPQPWNYLLAFFMGLPGYWLLSYTCRAQVLFSIGGRAYPFYSFFLLYCVPVTAMAVFLGAASRYLAKASARTVSLERVNREINAINRNILNRVFSLENNTAAEERRRISTDLHDTAGYVFANLIMMLQAAGATFRKNPEKAESLITEARDHAVRGMNEIRHILRKTRSYSPVYTSLQNELFNICGPFSKATGVTVELNYGGWPKTLGRELDSFFISLLQESLTNALKHGGASSISVQCALDGATASMSIADNGSGCVLPLKKGIGIASIEEYLTLHGGDMAIRANSGFRITVSVPLQRVPIGGGGGGGGWVC